ncbi:hypothetical protein [Providencia hangzhouensis]|uniref:hypothetical protein n=1 Tax=Providencia hangzhouensis TaxID=3031799 RepID=UPI003F4B2B6F
MVFRFVSLARRSVPEPAVGLFSPMHHGCCSYYLNSRYASISYIGNNDGNEILPVGDLIFSIEPKEDCQASLNSDGFNYVATSSTTNEGVYYESLKDGLESTQSYLRTLEYEAEATLEIDEPEQKSRSSYRA